MANDNALSTSQSGQTIVLFALLLIGLLALASLAIDGGHAYAQRRIVQNASDASAIGGLRYKVRANAPTEPGLMATVHQVVEAHGVPDSDGIADNEVNDNVLIYYTDDSGRRLTGFAGCVDGQSQAPCGSIPPPMRGLEVHVAKAFPTFFAAVIGLETMQASSKAIAVVRGNLADGASDRMLTALGEGCSASDPTFRMNNERTEIIGDVHSNSYVGSSGDGQIHYHGRATYVAGTWTTGANTHFDYPPTQTDPVSDPLADLRVSDFKCGTGKYAGAVCHDVENLCSARGDTKVRMQCLKAVGLYNEKTKQLADGLYYAGNMRMEIGEKGTYGSVTLVTSDTIKIMDSNHNLSSYVQTPAALLMFADKGYANSCSLSNPPVIEIATGGKRTDVHHSPTPPCVSDDPSCYTLGSNVITGLIYAPHGRVATSGNNGTFFGAILAWSIELNGNDQVFLIDNTVFPEGEPRISLGE